MPTALPPETIARFRGDLEALTGPLDTSARIGLAISGGADSLALLLLARAARLDIEVATVDHALRKASATEAAFVAALCARLDVPHAILTIPRLRRGNVSAAARDARYQALGSWTESRGLRWLLTAHHADDQLETFLMRLNRGSGVAGLASIRARRGQIARPLLGWRRADLAEIVAAAKIRPVDDPTNRDDRFDRARLRKVLETADWLDPLAVVRATELLAEADAALEWLVDKGWERLTGDGPVRLKWQDLPDELLRRHVLRALRAVDSGCNPRGEELTRLIGKLRDGKVATIGGVWCNGRGHTWTFAATPPRRASTSGS